MTTPRQVLTASLAVLCLACSSRSTDDVSTDGVALAPTEIERIEAAVPHYADVTMILEDDGSAFMGAVVLSVSTARVLLNVAGTDMGGRRLVGTMEVSPAALQGLSQRGVDVQWGTNTLRPGPTLLIPQDDGEHRAVTIESFALRAQRDGLFTGQLETASGEVVTMRGRLVGGCEAFDADGVTPRLVLDVHSVPECDTILGSF